MPYLCAPFSATSALFVRVWVTFLEQCSELARHRSIAIVVDYCDCGTDEGTCKENEYFFYSRKCCSN